MLRIARVSATLTCSLALTLALVLAGFTIAAPRAQAATDVVIAFDTTGSMEDGLDEAKSQVQDVVGEIDRRFGDVQFAVAGVRDYGDVYGDAGDEPWTLEQPMTADEGRIQAAIDGLYADGGGDGPEAYGSALRSADKDPAIGFRPGSQRLIVLVADSVPHDDDLNEGIAPADQVQDSPFDTGVDPGPDEIVGTGDDVDWQQQLGTLKSDAIPLYFVLFKGDDEYLPYWQTWAQETGGAASTSADGALGSTLIDVISAGAGGCSRAYARIGVLDVCADAIADRGDGTRRATGNVRIAGGVSAGDGPVVLDPSAVTLASEGVVGLSVARGTRTYGIGAGSFTISAAGTKDDISGRDRLAPISMVGADLTGLTAGGVSLTPGGRLYVDPADGGGFVIDGNPLFDLLEHGPTGTFAFGVHATSSSAIQVLGGSAGFDVPIGTKGWGARAGLEYNGADDTWKLEGGASFPGAFGGLDVDGVLKAGRIDEIGVKASAGETGIPLGDTGFFFDSISGSVSGLAAPPIKVKVGVTGGWGPKIPGLSRRPLSLDRADVTVGTDLTGAIDGQVGLVDRRIAGGDLDVSMALSPFHASGKLDADVGLLGTGFSVDGGIDMTSRHFTASGGAAFKVAGHRMEGANALISDAGAGASGKACGICPTVGAGIRWENAFQFPPQPEWIGGDIERYRTVKASSAAARKRTTTIRVAAGTAVLAIYATPKAGTSASAVELRGPGGRRVRLGHPGPLASVEQAPDGRVGFTVLSPRAGTWRVISDGRTSLTSARVPPLGTVAGGHAAPRGTRRRPLKKGTLVVRWRVSGRLPGGAKVALQTAPAGGRGGVTLASAKAGTHVIRVAVKRLPAGANRLSLVASVHGVPFQRVAVPGVAYKK
jgi:hypothetical protein